MENSNDTQLNKVTQIVLRKQNCSRRLQGGLRGTWEPKPTKQRYNCLYPKSPTIWTRTSFFKFNLRS